jgi:methylated-DNA-protein-cysteine methyltransferase-like protein
MAHSLDYRFDGRIHIFSYSADILEEDYNMVYNSPPDRIIFNAMVWDIVKQIPEGKVSTYGKIAMLIPPPEGMSPADYRAWGARWVGGAMAACPEGVPWQRVINSQGKISIRKGGGHVRQREMLESEGIIFDERDRVDLDKFGWDGPEA